MKIAVVGLGGVGAYIGAKLCALKEEHEIIFIARGEHLEAIKDRGLRLIDIDKEEVYIPTLATQTYAQNLDIIFLCTKSYHFDSALKDLSQAITKETLIIPIANGVNSIEKLQPLSPANFQDACVYIVSHKLEAGLVKKATKVFALMLPSSLENLLKEPLEKAGLRVRFVQDIQKEVWKKYLFISAMGNLTSYYKKGMGAVYQENEEELVTLLHEIFSVAKALKVKIEEKEIKKALETASNLPFDAPTSLFLDIQKGGENELETLSNYIVKTAQAYKINVPLMQKISEALNGK